jgi:hypothetical protein
MLAIPDAAIGAIAAALIAGVISLLGLIISKEQKTSEFRQSWIDGLRSELSLVIAHANAIYGAGAATTGNVASGGGDAAELWKVVREDFVGINEATARIRLRLNPREAQAQAVLAAIEDLERLLSPGRVMNYVEINDLEKRLVSEAQVLLKAEWVRVQKGESTYRIARFAALAIIVACVAALFLLSAAKMASV